MQDRMLIYRQNFVPWNWVIFFFFFLAFIFKKVRPWILWPSRKMKVLVCSLI